MNAFTPRTDLATESRELAALASATKDIEGVDYSEYTIAGTPCQELKVRTQSAGSAIGKPLGSYYTLGIRSLLRREDESFQNTTKALADVITRLTGALSLSAPILVVGLGNRDITPDAIGPKAASMTLVTRHLKAKMPENFSAFSPVSVITPGVLGTSGIESFDYIKSVCALVKPALVLAIDALAARSLTRLCTTVQVSDAGISPGSGVGNSRPEISRDTLGIPVIALGVPTVVDLRTAFSDYAQLQKDLSDPSMFDTAENMIVTPRSIDTLITSASRLVAYGINLALHPGLTISDVDMLLC